MEYEFGRACSMDVSPRQRWEDIILKMDLKDRGWEDVE
jgi:hypothetical protein